MLIVKREWHIQGQNCLQRESTI
ncbi:hypothetical protein PWA37_000270 [Arxiozyma heterogenica]